jgi:acyl dehydratase
MAVSSTAQPTGLTGTDFGPFTTTVETGALKLFARVIGQTDPVHTDTAAAVAAGYPGLLVPPTFLFSLERGHPELHTIVRRLGIDVGSMLHGEQRFRYDALTFAGDELTFRPRLTDAYERKGGALRFFVRETTVTRGVAIVAELRNVLVVRSGR